MSNYWDKEGNHLVESSKKRVFNMQMFAERSYASFGSVAKKLLI